MFIPTDTPMENYVRNATAYRYLDHNRKVCTVTVGMLVDRVRELEGERRTHEAVLASLRDHVLARD